MTIPLKGSLPINIIPRTERKSIAELEYATDFLCGKGAQQNPCLAQPPPTLLHKQSKSGTGGRLQLPRDFLEFPWRSNGGQWQAQHAGIESMHARGA